MKLLKPILALSGVGILTYAILNYVKKQKSLLALSDFNIVGVKVDGIDWVNQELNLIIDTQMTNNSGIDINLNYLYLDVYLNDELVGNVLDNDITLIPAASSVKLQLNSSFGISSIIKNVVTLINKLDFSNYTVRLVGSVMVNVNFVNVTVPIDQSQKL